MKKIFIFFTLFILLSSFASASFNFFGPRYPPGVAPGLVCLITGCTMQGNISMNFHSITDATLFNANIINSTITQLFTINATEIINPPWFVNLSGQYLYNISHTILFNKTELFNDLLWQNISNVATYDGSINVTKNITGGGYITQSPFKVYAPNGLGNLQQIIEYNTSVYKFIGGTILDINTFKLEIKNITLLATSRKIMTASDDFIVQKFYPLGNVGLGVQNTATHENASASLAVSNGNNRGMQVTKFSSNYTYPDLAILANNFGKLIISGLSTNNYTNCTSNNSGISFGFNDDFLRGSELSNYGYINFTSVMDLTPNMTCIWNFFHVNESAIFSKDVDIQGNLTTNNYYGHMWNYTSGGITVPLIGPGIYTNVSLPNKYDTNGFIFNNGILTCKIPGRYMISWSISISDGANNLYGASIVKNFDIEQSRNCYSRQYTPTAGFQGSITGNCILYLDEDDTLNLQIDDETNPKIDPTLYSISMTANRIATY